MFAATHARIEEMIFKDEIEGVASIIPMDCETPCHTSSGCENYAKWQNLHRENSRTMSSSTGIGRSMVPSATTFIKVNRLWMDDQRIDVLTATYSDFTGHSVDFGKLVREKKRDSGIDIFDAHQQLAAAALLIARTIGGGGLEPDNYAKHWPG